MGFWEPGPTVPVPVYCDIVLGLMQSDLRYPVPTFHFRPVVLEAIFDGETPSA